MSARSAGLKLLARSSTARSSRLPALRAVEQRTDNRPLLSDLRESGQIEADADAVIMLYRDDYYHEDSEPGRDGAHRPKNRQGKIGDLQFAWQPERMRIMPLASR